MKRFFAYHILDPGTPAFSPSCHSLQASVYHNPDTLFRNIIMFVFFCTVFNFMNNCFCISFYVVNEYIFYLTSLLQSLQAFVSHSPVSAGDFKSSGTRSRSCRPFEVRKISFPLFSIRNVLNKLIDNICTGGYCP